VNTLKFKRSKDAGVAMVLHTKTHQKAETGKGGGGEAYCCEGWRKGKLMRPAEFLEDEPAKV